METLKVSGVYPAMLTPMNADESVNYAELEAQFHRMSKAGVDALFVLGTNGEFFSLSHSERVVVMEKSA